MGLANDSDALVLAGVARRRAFDGYVMVDVPERPDFWFGNVLVLDAAPAPAARDAWIARHERHFASAAVRRRVIVWETDGAPATRALGAADAPADESRSIVFVRASPFGADGGGAAHAVREFACDADWNAAATLSIAAFAPDGDPAACDFERWRFASVRDAARDGRLRMWGAWDANELVAFAGVYANERVARFATPVTRPSHRRRGYFRALAGAAVDATLRARPRVPVVICAGASDDPAEVYRRLGFAVAGEQYAIVRAVDA